MKEGNKVRIRSLGEILKEVSLSVESVNRGLRENGRCSPIFTEENGIAFVYGMIKTCGKVGIVDAKYDSTTIVKFYNGNDYPYTWTYNDRWIKKLSDEDGNYLLDL
jgi:hypothetical protein